MIRVGSVFIGFMFLFLPSFLHSTNIEADFSVEFGIVGEVGKVHATLISDTHSYVLDANVSTQGIAKAVTHNLKERHISRGMWSRGCCVQICIK